MAFRTTLAVAATTAVAFLVAIASALPADAAAVAGCATPADIGKFVGWCACSTVVTSRPYVSPPSPAGSRTCDAADVPTPTFYCDRAGRGNCDLQCAAAIWECRGAPSGWGGRCPCAKGRVRPVLRYNGPLVLANRRR